MTPLAASDTCPNGGQQIDFGIDQNGNGVLDPDEVAGSVTICNGTDGGAMLVTLTPESAGGSCGVATGTRIDIGWDTGAGGGTAGDGVLQAGEILQTRYLCDLGTGVSEGSTTTPVTLSPWNGRHSTVAAGGISYYTFTAPQANWYLVELTGTDSDLRWTLYSDAFSTAVKSCNLQSGTEGDETCAISGLLAGHTYYLKVEERSNIPDLFDVLVSYNLLVGSDANGKVYRVNPATGATTLLFDPGLGELSALAYAPGENVLYAGTADSAACPYCIYRLNPYTGAAKVLTGPAPNGAVASLAVRPWDDGLYATVDTECPYLASVDRTTGAWTGIQDTDSCGGGGYGMTFDNTGALMLADHASEDTLFLMGQSPDDALPRIVNGYGFSGFPGPVGTVPALTTRPTDGTLFALTDAGYLATLGLVAPLEVSWVATPSLTLTSLAMLSRLPATYPVMRDIVTQDGGNADVVLSWRDYPRAQFILVYWGLNPGIDPANPSSYKEIFTVPRVDDSATTDFYDYSDYNVTHYFRLVPMIDGVPGPATDEVSETNSWL